LRNWHDYKDGVPWTPIFGTAKTSSKPSQNDSYAGADAAQSKAPDPQPENDFGNTGKCILAALIDT
jgi:hypothetical protein